MQGSYSAVEGLTPEIRQAVQNPWQEAFIAAASTVFLVSAAFSGMAIILAFFMQNNDKATADFVASNVHGQAAGKEYQARLKEERGGAHVEATNGHAGEKI